MNCPYLDSLAPLRQNGKRLPCERLAEENERLRELVRDFINAPCTTCDAWADGFRCWNYDGADCGLVAHARELGIEVDA